VVGYAKEGGYFGDFEYHKHSTRIGRYTAVNSCNLLSISNKALDEAIDNNVDAGLIFKKDLRKRFENVLQVNKTRTVAMDVPRDGLTIAQLNDINSQIQKATGGLQDAAKPSMMTRVSGAGLGMAKSTFNKMSMKRAAVSVAAVEHSDTDTDSDDDHFDAGIKVRGDPTKPKIYMKKEIWVDGVPKANVSAALESSTMNEEDVRPFRVLKLRPNCAVDPVTGSRPKVVEEETPKQLSARGIIYHNDPRKLQWDTLVGLLIVYNVLLIPVQEGFSWTMGTEVFCIDLFSDVIFTIDIPLSFRTSFFDDDEDAVVTVHSMCRWNYLSSWFAIDIMAQVPFAMFVIFEIGLISKGQQEQLNSFSLIRIVRLLRLLKLARLAKLGHYITKLEDTLGVNPITFDLLKMMLEVIFIGHMLACTWWAAHSLTVNNWTNHPSYPLSVIDEDDYTSKYVISLYWAFTTLATVGYGDIVPTNMTHRIVVILIMVLGATVFGYIVANVSTLMSDLDQTAARVSERISEITEFLKEKNCPKQLHNSIIRHFRHMFNQTSAFDEPGILQRLPNRIIREILLTQHQNKIKKISLFNFIDNQSVVLFIFRMMSPTYFEEHQAMLKEGEIGTEVLFVVSGRARVYKAKSTQMLVKARTERAKARKEEDIMEAQQREHTAKARRGSVAAKLAVSGRRESRSSSFDLDAEKTSAQQDVEQEMALTNSLGIINECDFIGHVSLMFGSRHQATVRALSNVTAYGLTRMDFQRIVRDHPGVALVLQMAMGEAVHALHRDLGKSYSRDLRVDFLGGLKKTFGAQKEAREKLLRAEQMKMAKKEKNDKPLLARQGTMINFLGFRGKAPSSSGDSGFNSHIQRPRLGSGAKSESDVGTAIDDSVLVSPQSSPDSKAAVRVIKMRSAKSVKVAGGGGAELEMQDSEGSGAGSRRFRMPSLLSFRSITSSSDVDAPVPGTKYVTPEDPASVQDFSLHPFGHPSRVRARRRWGLIRKCLQDARVTAAVASMNMHREAEAEDAKKGEGRWGKKKKKKTPEEIAEAQLAAVVRRNSVFARALQSKVGQQVGMTLDDSNMVYDSDDDKRKLALIKKVAVKQRYRCAEDLDDWLDALRVPQSRPPPPSGRLLRRRSSFPSGSADEWREDTRDLFVT
jgi:CRP-like cAMP-binding protein